MSRLIFVAVFLFLFYNLGAQDKTSPPPTPSMIADRLVDKSLDLETKDKLLDIAIDNGFKFNKEDSEKVKKFITQGLLSPYLSDKFKEKLIFCIERLEILISPKDELVSNKQILLNLSYRNREDLVSEIYVQGLYDQNYFQRLISLLKSEELTSADKITLPCGYEIFSPEVLKKIRNDSKSYAELREAIAKEEDKISDEERIERSNKLYKFLYNLVLQEEELLFKVNCDLKSIGNDGNEPWYSFYHISTVSTLVLEDEDSEYDPLTELAEKRLEVFYKKNQTEKDRESNCKYNRAYLESLLIEPGGVLLFSELKSIRPEKIYMFIVFFEKGVTMDICELAKDVLNKYNKGNPFFWDYRDCEPYLKKLIPKAN